ncbi:MAG: ComEC/Rec2 family competence protein, partial [Clostridia bacterium]|nr:ComEC/Rec2 family competence protein [Clostridia bacterium]
KTVYLDSLKVDGREFDGIAETVFVDGSLLDGLKIGDTVKFKADISSTNLVVTDAYSVSKHINKIYYRVYCREKIGDVDRVFSKIGERIKIIERIKLKVKSVLYSNVGSDTAGFLYAMTFGDKSGLDETVKSNFASTGTAHVFAVSGL